MTSFRRRDMPSRLLLLGDVGELVGLNRCVVGCGVHLATSDTGVCQAERRRGLGAISLDWYVRNADVVHLCNQHAESADADFEYKYRNCDYRIDGDAGSQAGAAFVAACNRFSVTVVYCVALNAVAPSAVGITGVLIGTPAILPQVWRAIRTEYLLGVSPSSYLLLASMSLGWFTHGILIDDAILSYPNLLLAPSALFIAWKAWSSPRRAAQVSVY